MDLSLDKQDLEFRDEFEERLQSHPPTRFAMSQRTCSAIRPNCGVNSQLY